MLAKLHLLNTERRTLLQKLESDQEYYNIIDSFNDTTQDTGGYRLGLTDKNMLQKGAKKAFCSYLYRSRENIREAQKDFRKKVNSLSTELSSEDELVTTLSDWQIATNNVQIVNAVARSEKIERVLSDRGIRVELKPEQDGGAYHELNNGVLIHVDSTLNTPGKNAIEETVSSSTNEMAQIILHPQEPLQVNATKIVLNTTLAPEQFPEFVGYNPESTINQLFSEYSYVAAKVIAQKRPEIAAKFFSETASNDPGVQIGAAAPVEPLHSSLDFMRLRFEHQEGIAPYFIPNSTEWAQRVTPIIAQTIDEPPELIKDSGNALDNWEEALDQVKDASGFYMEGFNALPFLPFVCGLVDPILGSSAELLHLAESLSLLVQLANNVSPAGIALPTEILEILLGYLTPARLFCSTARVILRFSNAHLEGLTAAKRIALAPLQNYDLFPGFVEQTKSVCVDPEELGALQNIRSKFFQDLW